LLGHDDDFRTSLLRGTGPGVLHSSQFQLYVRIRPVWVCPFCPIFDSSLLSCVRGALSVFGTAAPTFSPVPRLWPCFYFVFGARTSQLFLESPNPWSRPMKLLFLYSVRRTTCFLCSINVWVDGDGLLVFCGFAERSWDNPRGVSRAPFFFSLRLRRCFVFGRALFMTFTSSVSLFLCVSSIATPLAGCGRFFYRPPRPDFLIFRLFFLSGTGKALPPGLSPCFPLGQADGNVVKTSSPLSF